MSGSIFFFMQRITNVWNGLPGSIVKAKTQGTFENWSDGIVGELSSKRGNERAYGARLQLILTRVHVLMFLGLTRFPWINAQTFFAFSSHRWHPSQNSYFHIIKMTLAERARSVLPLLFFWRESVVVHEPCVEKERLRCVSPSNTKE